MTLMTRSVRLTVLRLIAWYLRTFAYEFVRWRLTFYAVREARKLGRFLGRKTITTKYGFRMRLDLNEKLGQHVYATGNWEDYTALVMRQLVAPGDTVVDVGANVGFFTLLAAQCVGPTGQVIAFEPEPWASKRLVHNVGLNNPTCVTIRNEAVSDHDGQTEMFVGPAEHRGLTSLRPLNKFDGNIAVRTVRLDQAFPPETCVRLIKIDVEGAECMALSGMQKLLATARPEIVIEVTDRFLKEMGGSAKALYQFLRDSGYRMYVIDWDGLVPVHHWSVTLPAQFNALFTHMTSLPSQLRIKESYAG